MNASLVHLDSALHTADLEGLRVFVRADLNVPLQAGEIIAEHRLVGILPTLNLIKEHGGHIILATHMGRPMGTDPDLSTEILVPWFEDHGFTVSFEQNLDRAQRESKRLATDILLLENLRFFPGEHTQDLSFARQLARLADYYVNDAFGLLHRTDTSITTLPELFSAHRRTIGLLVEQELTMLNTLLEQPAHPFVLVLGGAKIKDKLPLIKTFLPVIETLLICPAISFTFMKAQGLAVGKSLVDNSLLEASLSVIREAEQHNVHVVFPCDYQIASSFDAPVSTLDSISIPDDAVGVSIGPKTEKLFAAEIKKAGTVFLNGIFGNENNPKSLHGFQSVVKAMAQSQALTVIGGGDSVAVAQDLGLADEINYCSTGGGSTLTYLSGLPLPGLQVFIRS